MNMDTDRFDETQTRIRRVKGGMRKLTTLVRPDEVLHTTSRQRAITERRKAGYWHFRAFSAYVHFRFLAKIGS